MAASLGVLRRATARCLIVALAPLTLDACVSTEVVRVATTTTETATLEAKVFESVSDSRKDALSQRTLAWKLFDDRQSTSVPVREGTGNAWSADGLTPGRYRLQVEWGPKPADASGQSAGSDRDTLKLGKGERRRPGSSSASSRRRPSSGSASALSASRSPSSRSRTASSTCSTTTRRHDSTGRPRSPKHRHRRRQPPDGVERTRIPAWAPMTI